MDRMNVILLVLLICAQKSATSQEADIYACDSPVYCHGKLLDTVQMAGLFDDSKTFVDKPMKFDQGKVLENFERLYSLHDGQIPVENLSTFVGENFEEEGHELEKVSLPDWKARPQVFYKIRDVKLRKWANELNILWKDLARKMVDGAESNRSSIIHVPNTFVVPGGRFREFYYWDTYWIIGGLLISEMTSTAKGQIENLISVADRYGFVPNGGRIYYTRRTQPPLLTQMAALYYHHTNDIRFLRAHIGTLEREYKFWMGRTVPLEHEESGKPYGLARYRAGSNMPRPEGYRQDVEAASGMENTMDTGYCEADDDADCDSTASTQHSSRHELYRNIASACESGWDFSTRWFRDHQTLPTVMTEHIIPVDLNSFLCANERLLSEFYADLGDTRKSAMYRKSYEVRRDAMHALLWNERYGIWYDYDMQERKQRRAFFASNFMPLFAQCYKKDKQIDKVLHYIDHHMNLTGYAGGVPTSLAKNTNQQWDFPNSWPPLVHMLVEGLANTGHEEAHEMALTLAQNWISSNYKGWTKYHKMFEKYDSVEPGERGGGGEYDVQTGFGWTNGVALMLLDRFGNDLEAKKGRGFAFGLTLEVLVCIMTLSIIFLLICCGVLTYLKKRHELSKRGGMSASESEVRYSPVNTNANDNHVQNHKSETL